MTLRCSIFGVTDDYAGLPGTPAMMRSHDNKLIKNEGKTAGNGRTLVHAFSNNDLFYSYA